MKQPDIKARRANARKKARAAEAAEKKLVAAELAAKRAEAKSVEPRVLAKNPRLAEAFHSALVEQEAEE